MDEYSLTHRRFINNKHQSFMSTWFETKVRYDKVVETGAQKSVTETFLVDALSFTEAEARVTKEMEPYITGDFSVSAVRRNKFMDVFFKEGGERWYKVKAAFITIDEKTAEEKRSNNLFLVQAEDFENALTNFVECMSGTLADYEIASIVETPIMDVFVATEQ